MIVDTLWLFGLAFGLLRNLAEGGGRAAGAWVAGGGRAGGWRKRVLRNGGKKSGRSIGGNGGRQTNNLFNHQPKGRNPTISASLKS